MAGRACPPNTETDPELQSPIAKKSKLSSDTATTESEPDNNGSNIEAATDHSTNTPSSNPSEANVEQQQAPETLSDSEIKNTPGAELEATEVLASSDESFGDEEEKGKIHIGEEELLLLLQASSSSSLSASAPQQAQKQQAQQEVKVMGKEGGAETTLLGENAYYQDLSVIGDGAYGTVYKAKDKGSGQIVALKRIRVPLSNNGLPPYTVREIATLKKLNESQHPHIVKLLDVCQGNYLQLVTRDGKSERVNDGLTLWLVFEHVDRDLAAFISTYKSRPIPPLLIKQMAKEILLGVDFLHSQRVVHRDLKPHNLLVTSSGHIKIADFGLAKTYDFEMKLTSVVVTLWYRAPEVLLRCTYASPIDIWSVGCILAELYELKPLFPGTSEGDQLDKIFRIIGTPRQEEWPQDVSLSWSAFPFRNSKSMEMIIPNSCSAGLDLIKSMLIFNPRQRITACQALQHPYFTKDDPR